MLIARYLILVTSIRFLSHNSAHWNWVIIVHNWTCHVSYLCTNVSNKCLLLGNNNILFVYLIQSNIPFCSIWIFLFYNSICHCILISLLVHNMDNLDKCATICACTLNLVTSFWLNRGGVNFFPPYKPCETKRGWKSIWCCSIGN